MTAPSGYTTVLPYLVAEDAPRLLGFLVDGLGGIEIGSTLADDGRIRNARVRFAETTIMLSQATSEFPARQAALYLYVADAKAAVARAVAAGGSLIMPVADMPYGDRQGGVEDPGGNIWWISQRLIDAPYDG